MKVLVTGSKGFVGKNLVVRLEQEGYDVVTYDIGDKLDTNVDFIFHFAGVNRPVSGDFSANWTILEDIMKTATCPIMLSSSSQAELDNAYGWSKVKAEELLKEYKYNYYIYRFKNIFGKWCKPNYNSVVATWCYNQSHKIPLQVSDELKELELIYIDDLCDEMVKLLRTGVKSEIVSYKVTLGRLKQLISNIDKDVRSNNMPDFSDLLYKKLFSTYLTYIDNFTTNVESHKDDRGSFTELFKSNLCGMVSINVMKPGQVKGNHYHNSKWEYFVVIKGEAEIEEEDIITHNTKTYFVTDNLFKPVIMVPGYNHKIKNLGKEDCIFIIYTNELYDKDAGDTWRMSN